jgi:hypothetical protein
MKPLELKPQLAALTHLWAFEHYRQGPNGLYLLGAWKQRNVLTDEGIDAWLDIMLDSGTQITAWYFEPFESNTTPLVTHTYAVPVYTPCTAYDEATRQEFVVAAASGQSSTNSANKATLTFNATKTIYGCGLVGGGGAATTKADTAGGGTLFSSSLFGVAKPVVSTDVLNIALTVSLADS